MVGFEVRGSEFGVHSSGCGASGIGQTIFVTEGVGLCQRRGGAVEVIRAGDRVFFEPGEEHWHGAAPGRFMTHVAMHQVDEKGSAVTWGEHVSDDEYAAARSQ